MRKRLFLKVWTGVLSTLALARADVMANISAPADQNDSHDNQISVNESRQTDLFLRHAKETYSDQMLFAAHRSHSSHSSHSSHYSSRTYDSGTSSTATAITPSTGSQSQQATPSTTMVPSNQGNVTTVPQTLPSGKKYNITDTKMVQISLNLLGYDAGKIDGAEGGKTKAALSTFQAENSLEGVGTLDAQTCLSLARKINEKFPEDQNAQTICNDLLKLYMKLTVE